MVELRWPGRAPLAAAPDASPAPPLRTVEAFGSAPPGGFCNRLVLGERSSVLRSLAAEFAGQVDLVYIDPPFNSDATFAYRTTVQGPDGVPVRVQRAAYDDRWDGSLDAYLPWLDETFRLLVPLLRPDGSLFVHLDWHAVHYAKVLLDELLSPRAFRAEIVWRYRRWPARTANLQRMHDTLLYYARDPDRPPTFHTLYEPLAPSTQQTFGTRRQRADFSSGRRRPGTDDEPSPGAPLSDVWDIAIVAPSGHERLGYPTQKPEALLERVLRVASDEDSLVLDCFCGSGTTAAVAERLRRRWIAADLGPLAIHTARRRLLGLPSPRPFVVQHAGASPALPAASLAARLFRRGPRARLALDAFAADGAPTQGLDAIEAWAVDWDHDGHTFRAHAWHGRRAGRPPPLEASHTYPSPGAYQIAVRAFDRLGSEGLWRRTFRVDPR